MKDNERNKTSQGQRIVDREGVLEVITGSTQRALFIKLAYGKFADLDSGKE